jgi:hypothetical protein
MAVRSQVVQQRGAVALLGTHWAEIGDVPAWTCAQDASEPEAINK